MAGIHFNKSLKCTKMIDTACHVCNARGICLSGLVPKEYRFTSLNEKENDGFIKLPKICTNCLRKTGIMVFLLNYFCGLRQR